MTREDEARAESAMALPERVCVTCRRRYTNENTHVETDVHLEAMAVDTIREWLAMPADAPVAGGIAKQIARKEQFYDDFHGWRRAMGNLPDNDETRLIERRISWLWLVSLREAEAIDRVESARTALKVEATGFDPKALKGLAR